MPRCRCWLELPPNERPRISDLVPGPELDRLMAIHVMGWKLLTIGYYETSDVTPLQMELAPWIEANGIESVGDYYIDVHRNFWIEARSFKPSASMDDVWKCVNHVAAYGAYLRIEPDVRYSYEDLRHSLASEGYARPQLQWAASLRSVGSRSATWLRPTAPHTICLAILDIIRPEGLEP